MNGLFGSMNIGDRQYGGSSMGLANDLNIFEKLHEKDILFCSYRGSFIVIIKSYQVDLFVNVILEMPSGIRIEH